jgi:iron(III) transport system permease protein
MLVLLTLLAALLVALPLLALGGAALHGLLAGGAAAAAAYPLWSLLPGYVGHSLLLCVLVGVGVVLLGFGAALVVTLFDFPGRRLATWALVLPLAAPAYVLAYAYTDFFQPSGSLYLFWRQLLGDGALGRAVLRGLDIRNVWGAAFVLAAALYPYVYVLARAALLNAGANAVEAAQSLGLGFGQRVARVLLPAARPAVAAGVALAMMETLADYGVTAYFGVQTLTTGIYKAWLNYDDWLAATQLSVGLLSFVALVVWLERASRRRLRFARGANSRPLEPVRLRGARAALAIVAAWLPVLAGFVLPVAILLKLAADAEALHWVRFGGWLLNTLKLGLLAATVAFAFAALLVVGSRLAAAGTLRLRALQWAGQTLALGYAVPGAVIAVGILLPAVGLRQFGIDGAAAALTATALGLVYAYLVRFTAVAYKPLEAGYAQLSRRIDETARTLGAGSARLVFGIHAPLLRAAAASAWLIVLIDVMKELPATLLLRPFGYDTLAVAAHQFARDERLGEAALPALAIVGCGLLPVMLLMRGMAAGRRSREAALPGTSLAAPAYNAPAA